MSYVMIKTIKKIKVDGKYLEFWFEDSIKQCGGYDLSCKGYIIDLLVNDADIGEHIANNGFKGLRMVWALNGANYEPYCFAAGGALNG